MSRLPFALPALLAGCVAYEPTPIDWTKEAAALGEAPQHSSSAACMHMNTASTSMNMNTNTRTRTSMNMNMNTIMNMRMNAAWRSARRLRS